MPTKRKRASFTKHIPTVEVKAEAMPVVVDETEAPVVSKEQAAGPEEALEVVVQPVPELEKPNPELESMLQNDAQESALSKKNKRLYGLGMIITLGIIMASISIYALYMQTAKTQSKADVAGSSQPTPTATPIPVFKPGDITVEVLNGSGVAGAALKASIKLKAKGYVVVSTGNAKKTSGNTIQISTRMSSSDTKLFLTDITELFGATESSGDVTDSTASAVLVLGSN